VIAAGSLRVEGEVKGAITAEGDVTLSLWGSKTAITLVTCGFGRAGRQSDRCESPCLKARTRPSAANRRG